MSTEDALTSTETPQAGAPDLPREVLLRGVRRSGPLPWRGSAGTRVSPLTLTLREWQGEIASVSAGPLRNEDGVGQGACLTCALVKTRQGNGPADADAGRNGGQPPALHIQVTGPGPGLGPWGAGAGAGDLR